MATISAFGCAASVKWFTTKPGSPGGLCLEAMDLLFQADARPRIAVEGAADAPAALPKIGG
jgi:hypothetical protein